MRDAQVNNLATTNSIYKDKNNNKFKNKLVKAFRNMHHISISY